MTFPRVCGKNEKASPFITMKTRNPPSIAERPPARLRNTATTPIRMTPITLNNRMASGRKALMFPIVMTTATTMPGKIFNDLTKSDSHPCLFAYFGANRHGGSDCGADSGPIMNRLNGDPGRLLAVQSTQDLLHGLLKSRIFLEEAPVDGDYMVISKGDVHPRNDSGNRRPGQTSRPPGNYPANFSDNLSIGGRGIGKTEIAPQIAVQGCCRHLFGGQ